VNLRPDDSKGTRTGEGYNSPQIPVDASVRSERARAHTQREQEKSEFVLARWLAALKRESPNLSQPIAMAMTEGALRGPLGQSLSRIEIGLIEIENESLDRLTGSEVRVLTAILHALTDTAARLDGEIAQLYVTQAH
jgi:hypothetical protein